MDKDVCVFLFDVTGIMAQPWLEAGYECWTVDLQHPPAYETGGITREGNLVKVHADLRHPWLCPVDRNRIAFAFAFPPCDHLAVSGARWFKGKGLRRLSLSLSRCSPLQRSSASGLVPHTALRTRSVRYPHIGENQTTRSARTSTPVCAQTTTTRRRRACGSETGSSCQNLTEMKVSVSRMTEYTAARQDQIGPIFAAQLRSAFLALYSWQTASLASRN